MKSKARTITLLLDDATAKLLDAVMLMHGNMSTPTQVVRSCAEVGLMRLAVACSHSPLAAIRDAAKEALRTGDKTRIASACYELKP